MRVRGVAGALVLLVLLTPALVLTFVRLVEPASDRAVRLESFTPWAIPVYGVVLLAVLAWLALTRSRALLVPSVLVLAGLAVHLWWFAPMVTGANPPPAAGAETLRVMTANLYVGAADGISVVQAAVDEDIDVLVLQEVTPELLVTMDEAGLDAAFEFRAGEPADGSQGTMVFSRTELGEATLVETTWDSWLVPMGETTLLAVHPHAPTDVAAWRRDHHLIQHAVEADEPDLVVGDFNATPDHPELRELADAGYRSVTELANDGWQPTWPDHGYGSAYGLPLPRSVQIDHVLVGPAYAALGTHTVELPGSDHRALVAEVAAK